MGVVLVRPDDMIEASRQVSIQSSKLKIDELLSLVLPCSCTS